MKKFLLLLCLSALIYKADAQATYYWVGGTGPVTFTGSSRWNTALNGSGTARTTADTTDILIFDGTNVGGSTPATGTVNATITTNKCGQLKLQNNASLVLSRPTGGGAGTLTITGGTGEDFVVNSGSSFTINSIADSGAVVVLLQNPATGLVSGNFTLTNTAASRITVQQAGALVFTGTAVCTLATQPATASYPFGSATQGVEKGIVFSAGSQLINTGKYSPMSGTSTYMAIDFKPGSNYYIRASNAASTGSWTANKVFGNLYIQNSATFTSDGAIYKIENFTIDAGCSFITHTSGQTPVTGNLVVNGSLTGPAAASTNVLLMGGNVPQNISGAGTITVPAFSVADNSSVTLGKNIVTTAATTTLVAGKLDFGTSVISGTSPFTSRVSGSAAAVTGSTTAGSTIITNVSGTLSGNTALTISGAGIPANANVIGFSTSNNTISMSQAATATASGVALTFASNAATLATAHPNGFDSATGCVIVTGAKSYGSGTNYIINGANTHPVGISSNAGSTITVGNLILNASATTNHNIRVNGTATLNNGIFSIRPTDTVRIFSGNDIAGGNFSSGKYIATTASATSVGVLRIDTISTTKTFPVGTTTDYLPVTVTPSDNSNISVSVFNGLTVDGKVTGAAFTALQKARVVDATWIVNRTKGTGNTDITLNWTNNLEGVDFANYSNAEIGISRYDAVSTNWTDATAISANNNTNTATASYSSFGSFGIGRLNEVLPVKINKISARADNKNVIVTWSSLNEINIGQYAIERSIDGRNFIKTGSITAKNATGENNYSFIDKDVAGSYYYRIVATETNGSRYYSSMVKVTAEATPRITVYPNPASSQLMVSGITQGSTIQIINVLGKAVYNSTAGNQLEIINIKALTPGVWFVKITQSNGNITNSSFIKN